VSHGCTGVGPRLRADSFLLPVPNADWKGGTCLILNEWSNGHIPRTCEGVRDLFSTSAIQIRSHDQARTPGRIDPPVDEPARFVVSSHTVRLSVAHGAGRGLRPSRPCTTRPRSAARRRCNAAPASYGVDVWACSCSLPPGCRARVDGYPFLARHRQDAPTLERPAQRGIRSSAATVWPAPTGVPTS
jgi:hypothetical protein